MRRKIPISGKHRGGLAHSGGYAVKMTESTNRPDLANATKIGGGGTEPDQHEQPAAERPEPDHVGAGVDLKTEGLSESED